MNSLSWWYTGALLPTTPDFTDIVAEFTGKAAPGPVSIMSAISSLLQLVAGMIWGQPSIYFPIGDHVNVSWCCSHTNASGVISTSHIVASHIPKLLLSFRQILQFRFWDNPQGRIPPWKVTKTRPFLSMCYGDPSATEVPPCCETATKKLTFSTTSVLLLLNMPLSLSRATIFRRQKNPRRVYRPKIAGILFVCNEPEGKYYTVPIWLM